MQTDKTISRGMLDDLACFAAVARVCSFSRAAAELNMSNSMLSYTIKRLEKRIGYALLRRTSRSVAPTAEGSALLAALEPALGAIDATLDNLDRSLGNIAGSVRITATRQAYEAAIRPVLREFCERYPDANIECIIDNGLVDLISGRFDAGIRWGDKLEKDMVALRVARPLRMIVVASPHYFSSYPIPISPEDLQHHRCINYRMQTAGNLYEWEFEKGHRKLKIAVTGPLTFNEPDLMLHAAIDGLGVAYLLEHEAASAIAAGRLIQVLAEWTQPSGHYFLYYPSRKQVSPVLGALLMLLREQLHIQ